MRSFIGSLLLLTSIYFVILPSVMADAPAAAVSKTQSRIFDLKNIFIDKNGPDNTEINIKLKMVTRIVAGLVLIVGILSTIAVQFKVISMGLGTVSENPETLGGLIILMLLPETIVLLSFVISTLLLLI